jgi:hypothetical protein
MAVPVRWWIAINGASCARSSMPFTHPTVKPTPWQLIGFPTHKEACEAQRICLEEPIGRVAAFMQSLRQDVLAGRVKVIQPEHPEPPTRGPTAWFEDLERTRALS